jgi:hypothetical protein
MKYPEVPPEVVARLRPICLGLPDAYEETAWRGLRWMVRKKTFAHVLAIEEDRPLGLQRIVHAEPIVVVTFRSAPPELDALKNLGHPYFAAGWGRDVVGIIIEDATDWDELAELMADSYCVMAPKKLAALVTQR